MASEKFTHDLLASLPSLKGFAMSLCRNATRAEDLVQDTVLRALGHHDSYLEGSNMGAWLFTILRNSYFTELRKKRREVDDVDGVHAATFSVSGEQEWHMEMCDFMEQLSTLSPEQREVLILIGAAGFTYEQASAETKVNVGTLKSRLNRARESLINKLGFEKGRGVERGTHRRRKLAAPQNNIALPKPAPVKRYNAMSDVWKMEEQKANAKKLPFGLPPATVDLEVFGIGFVLHQTMLLPGGGVQKIYRAA